MIARLFNPDTDIAEGDRLLNDNKDGDVRLDRDLMGVTDAGGGKLSGICVGRPSVFVHGFVIDRSTTARPVAEHLLGFAVGFLKAKGHGHMTFLVAEDNTAMQQFMEDHGARKERKGIVYTLNF